MMRARLVTIQGEATPSTCDLDPHRPVTLGRSRENSVILHDEHASRRHARLYHEDGLWFIRDCATRNGTRVNSVRLQDGGEMALQHGHEIQIAEMRLLFEMVEANGRAAPERELPQPVPSANGSNDSSVTTLHADELAVLHEFMTTAIGETDSSAVIRRALTAIARQARATVAGFLSLDEEEPLPRMVYPEKARVDFALSKQLTARVQKDGQPVWLKSGVDDLKESESLMPFQDAVCIPLMAEGTPLGALHAYKSGRFFRDREVRFCEMVAGITATSLARLRQCRSLEAENSRLLRGQPPAAAETIIGASSAIAQLNQMIAKAASCRSTVLIRGETGAGKELVALALHRQSARRHGPMVVANCGAIPSGVIESELFGHLKGAFTGAVADRAGMFERADNGTLFLDEIGDMPLDCQVKVLRVLEGKGFWRVGGGEEIRTDVRLLAATHKDLDKEVRANRFRQDLYWRLNVLEILVPPLREHSEDVPALVDHFLDKLIPECGCRKTLSASALQRLVEYPWPGNVRELRTVIENAVMMSDGDVIETHDLRLHDAPMLTGDFPQSLNLEHVEAWAIRQALQKTKGNVTRGARILGIARETLATKLKKYGIDRADCQEEM